MQPLEVELRGDPQVELAVELVVVGDERPRGRAAVDRLQHRRLDLDEARVVEEAADGGDHLRARDERLARPPRWRGGRSRGGGGGSRRRRGRGACRAAGAATWRAASNPVSCRVSSPARVFMTVPSTPIRSPRSRSSRRAKASSPRTLTRAMSCMRPERSTRSRNAALPWPRRAARRPAMRAATSVSSPAARSSCGALTSAMGWTPGKACGNGSTPAARSSSSLRRRSSRTWLGSGGPRPATGLGDADLVDGERALALRRRHLHLVALLVADQRLADRATRWRASWPAGPPRSSRRSRTRTPCPSRPCR